MQRVPFLYLLNMYSMHESPREKSWRREDCEDFGTEKLLLGIAVPVHQAVFCWERRETARSPAHYVPDNHVSTETLSTTSHLEIEFVLPRRGLADCLPILISDWQPGCDR